MLEIIIGNETNVVHLWNQITKPCEGKQVKHFWSSHFKTNIQLINIYTHKEFVDLNKKNQCYIRITKRKKKKKKVERKTY